MADESQSELLVATDFLDERGFPVAAAALRRLAEGKVWLVSTGSYSDYSISAIFDDKALAEAYVASLGPHNEADIEEFSLNPEAAEMRQGYKRFHVVMMLTGEARIVELCQYFTQPATRLAHWRPYPPEHIAKHRTHAPYLERGDLNFANPATNRTTGGLEANCLDCIILARDSQHAVKIANERRMAWIAERDMQANIGGNQQ